MIDSIDKMNMKDQFNECVEKCKQVMNRDLDTRKLMIWQFRLNTLHRLF